MIQWELWPVLTMAVDSVTCARTRGQAIFHWNWSMAELLVVAVMMAAMVVENLLLIVHVDDGEGEYPTRMVPIYRQMIT